MLKERWFNYRPICLVFLFLLLGSIFAFYITSNTILCAIISILTLALLLTISIKKKKIKYFLIPFIAFILGVGSYFITTYNFNKKVDYAPSVVEARIYSVGKANDSYLYVEADNVSLDGKEINENIIIYIYDTDSLYSGIEIGSKVKLNPSSFYHSDLFKYETPYASLIASNIKYVASTNIKNLRIKGVDKTFAEIIKQKVKENLALSLTNENVEIAYSALFGEKELLSDGQYSAYKLSGVAHLLAVSGLHVGIIVGIFTKIFQKFKSKKAKIIKLAVIAPFLLFYMYICNFAYSIIRATIMAIILLISDICGAEYDSFNAISIAGIVIYILNPLCVFDISFLMSFSCVMGITMLNKPINTMLLKFKYPKKLASSIAMSLSSTIALVFIMAFYFQTLNIISILANIILIPIFTIAFSIAFVVSMISIFIPAVGYVLYGINYIFDFINVIATMFGNLSISNFNTLRFNYIAIFIYFMLLLFLGRFNTAKYRYKVMATLPIVALLLVCLI